MMGWTGLSPWGRMWRERVLLRVLSGAGVCVILCGACVKLRTLCGKARPLIGLSGGPDFGP